MPVYLLRIISHHLSFRIPELLSIAKLFDFEIKFLSQDLYRGILLVELEGDEQVQHILDRGVLVIAASRLIASGATYEELHINSRQAQDKWEPTLDRSFKFEVEGINHHILDKRAVEVIQGFHYVNFRGPVRLKKPEVRYYVYEDYDPDDQPTHTGDRRVERDGKFRHVYVARMIGESRARPLIVSHSVKTRAYFGNTSMEAEMGFLMAGQTLWCLPANVQSAPGKVVYDPFVGTGSMLYSCAQFGATVFGSDIDGRQMRGKGKGKGADNIPGIMRAATQYGVRDQVLDCLTFDVTQHPWRRGGWLDAIVTDPPYGVRAGAKRLGKKDLRRPVAEEPFKLPDGRWAHELDTYLPPCKPYELVDLMLDLIHMARWMLVPGGRLVFFLPTASEEYDEVDIPVVSGMREIKWEQGSVQDFGKWGRRLITMEKTTTDDIPPPTFDKNEEEYERLGGKVPGHYQFHKKYAKGFRDSTQSQDSTPAASPPA